MNVYIINFFSMEDGPRPVGVAISRESATALARLDWPNAFTSQPPNRFFAIGESTSDDGDDEEEEWYGIIETEVFEGV